MKIKDFKELFNEWDEEMEVLLLNEEKRVILDIKNVEIIRTTSGKGCYLNIQVF